MMAQPQAREAGFDPSSPHSSSGGADSYNHEGTPDTRLTAFSPEESSAKSAGLMTALTSGSSETGSVAFSTQQAVHYRTGQTQPDKDPFVSSTPARKQEQKLSATASAFRPFSTPAVVHGPDDATSGILQVSAFDPARHISAISPNLSTDSGLSRCLVVSSPQQSIDLVEVERLLAKLDQLGSPCRGSKQIHIKGPAAYLRFANVRDACLVHQSIRLENATWVAHFISPTEFIQITRVNIHHATDYEGQLIVAASACPGVPQNVGFVESTVLSIFCTEGDVFAINKAATPQLDSFKAVVEFADTEVAISILSKYSNGAVVNGVNLVVTIRKSPGHVLPPEAHTGIATPIATPISTPVRNSAFNDYNHDIFQGLPQSKTPQPAPTLAAAGHPTPPHLGLPLSPQMPVYHPLIFRPFAAPAPYLFDRLPPPQSPTASSIASFGALTPLYSSPGASAIVPTHHELTSPRQMQAYNRGDGRRQNAMRVNRSSYYNPAGHHNHVDVNRIREGVDVRTTIMLRNIPNKVDQAMLKRIVDESSWGKYDFMYLRIDFANDCNVGYAFINFVDPLDIIDFVNARGNQRWNCFKSDKVAEISYATIQGKDCLVQKFRNSSVMLEAPHYRPKLYFTSNGPTPQLAGQEEGFPPPDNQSKMKRSCENAEHVGLFTPNAGQHFRDEQRRRRSQFDRGTRLAALDEEYSQHEPSFEAAFQQLYV